MEALDAGADDYLVKPFPLAELLARVRSLLRRSYAKKTPVMQVADLELDPRRRTVCRKEQPVELTALEYRLLEYLFYRSGEVVSRTSIWEHVFKDSTAGSSTLRAIGLGIYPFVTPEESARMQSSGNIIDPKNMPHILVVARDKKSIYRVLNRTRWVLGVGTLLTLGLGFLLIDRVIRVTLRPIDELTAQMKDRAGHQLDSALDLPEALPTELTGLAENFDSLLSRVATIRQRERDFIRHAAHELRTPIAGLRATTDLALSQPRDAAAYAAHLKTCQKVTFELGDLVKRLSALSRIGQEGSQPHLETVDPAGILAECLEPFLPLFKHRGLKVTRDLPAAPIPASGDVTLLRIIFNNLLDNAVSYATSGGEIRIRGGIIDGRMEIRIANKSDDLPDNLDRLFEPLFRKEFSRSDAGIHLGIGLTLSLEAAAAMGATLQARKAEGGWVEFVLTMPVLISEPKATNLLP